MYSFLVLGQIPGTNLVVSFQVWLGLFAVLAGIWLVHRVALSPVVALLRIGRALEIRWLMLYSRALVPMFTRRSSSDIPATFDDITV